MRGRGCGDLRRGEEVVFARGGPALSSRDTTHIFGLAESGGQGLGLGGKDSWLLL